MLFDHPIADGILIMATWHFLTTIGSTRMEITDLAIAIAAGITQTTT